MDSANLFREKGLGLVAPADPKEAAATFAKVLADESQLRTWSTLSRDFSIHHFDPLASARGYIKLYHDVAGDALRLMLPPRWRRLNPCPSLANSRHSRLAHDPNVLYRSAAMAWAVERMIRAYDNGT